jgi:hypothetical protein
LKASIDLKYLQISQALGEFEMRLYRSNNYPDRWFAFSPEAGWVMFPAEPQGWGKRLPARGFDPMYAREVPLQLAANTGLDDAIQWGLAA